MNENYRAFGPWAQGASLSLSFPCVLMCGISGPSSCTEPSPRLLTSVNRKDRAVPLRLMVQASVMTEGSVRLCSSQLLGHLQPQSLEPHHQGSEVTAAGGGGCCRYPDPTLAPYPGQP